MGGDDDAKRSGLLSLNDLTYLLEPDLSVATNVTQKSHFFQATEFTQNQRAVCIINSGADYIDTRSSYLKFGVRLEGTTVSGARLYFGKHGSAVNLIKNITVTSRSGDEISRITDVNRLHAMMVAYRYDTAWWDTVGQAMGVGSFISTENVFDSSDTKSRINYFTIPLYCLTDFFGYGRLMPSMIMSGLRIEIEFEDLAVAGIVTCHTTSATNIDPRFGKTKETNQALTQTEADSGQDGDVTKLTGFKILDPVIVLKSVQLTDATQRSLNELSATNGLELVFTDFERTETNYPAATSRAHIEIRKACSRALSAVARVRLPPSELILGDGSSTLSLSYKDKHVDSFASEPKSDIVEYQWQLGSLYFPQQPIKGNVQEVINEGYLQTLDALGKLRHNSEQPHGKLRKAVSRNDSRSHSTTTEWIQEYKADHLYENYKIGADGKPKYGNGDVDAHYLYEPIQPGRDPGTFDSYGQTWIQSLERSSMFELAGVPINNSRVLALRMNFSESKKRTIDVYLKYVKLARLFLNNVEIEQ